MKRIAEFLLAFIFLVNISVSKSVKITSIKVPPTYTKERVNELQPIELDCQYEMESNEKGFVLKWLFNNNCIYQWIPSVKGFAMGPMKTKILINNEISRGTERPGHISISQPDWNMTGEYTCLVQTFESADRKSAHLQIIVPELTFALKLKHPSDSFSKSVNIFCTVAYVFPKPVLLITVNNQQLDGVLIKENKDKDGLYTIAGRTEISKEKLDQPTPISCVFYLLGTNYTKRRETIFYDHTVVSTTVDPNKEEISSAISRLEGSGKLP
ncbi:hypothetical protein ACFFRR_008415 [Megaselia abdita]